MPVPSSLGPRAACAALVDAIPKHFRKNKELLCNNTVNKMVLTFPDRAVTAVCLCPLSAVYVRTWYVIIPQCTNLSEIAIHDRWMHTHMNAYHIPR